VVQKVILATIYVTRDLIGRDEILAIECSVYQLRQKAEYL